MEDGEIRFYVPRVRGDEPAECLKTGLYATMFPACAGMNRIIKIPPQNQIYVPRVRGDEPW